MALQGGSLGGSYPKISILSICVSNYAPPIQPAQRPPYSFPFFLSHHARSGPRNHQSV